MRKVIHLINHADTRHGGAQKILSTLLQQWPDRSSVIAFDTAPTPSHLSKPITFIKVLIEILKTRDSIFLIHHRIFLPIFALIPKRAIFVAHNIFPDKNWVYKIITRIHCIAVSNEAKQYLLSHNKNLNISVIPNGIHRSPEENRIPLMDGIFRVGFVGRLDRQKGIDLLAEAFLQIIEKHPERRIELHIVGEGELLPSLLSLLDKAKPQKNIFFHGYSSTPFNILKTMDLICIPSRYEGFGLVFFEAIIRNHIILCSDIEIFKNNSTSSSQVHFFLNDSLESLTQKILKLSETKTPFIEYQNTSKIRSESEMILDYEKVLWPAE